jgi:hypothetical protein
MPWTLAWWKPRAIVAGLLADGSLGMVKERAMLARDRVPQVDSIASYHGYAARHG